MRVLFQGDSITDGNRYKSKASEWDKNHQIGHSYVYILTGLLGMTYPECGYEFVNKGVSGNIVTEMEARWQTDAIEIEPDVLSILIGVNDCIRACGRRAPDFSAEAYEAGYRRILTASREKNPDLKLILLEPFLHIATLQYDTKKEIACTAILKSEQKIVRKLAKEFGAIFVPLQEIFDEAKKQREPRYWLWDGIHPTEAGHALIAREFMKATKDIFGEPLV